MKTRPNLLNTTLFLLLPLVLTACVHQAKPADSVFTQPAAQDFNLTVLHINDHHSHLDEEVLPLTLETSDGKRESLDTPVGGFARISAAFKELSQPLANVIKIHAGDAITGDLYYSLTHGKADADLMNTVCFDTMTLGNHEFDHHDSGLKTFIDFLHAGDCQTKVLSANTLLGADSVLNPAKARNYIQPSTVIERNGQKIGLVGITVADKTKSASRPDEQTRFADEAITAQAEIDKLTAQGINKIILQTHYGYEADQALAKKLRGVDVIIGADSHTFLGPKSLALYGVSAEGNYPTLTTDANGKTVCIAQAGQHAYAVGQLNIRFDKNGDVAHCAGTPHVVIGDTFKRSDAMAPALTITETASVKADIAKSGALRITQPSPAALALLAPYKQKKEDFGSKVIATADSTFCLRRMPGANYDQTRSTLGDICNKNAHAIAHGGDIQQLIAELFLYQGKSYFNADLSIQNAGGVRVDLQSGPVTVKDVYSVLPFKNTLVQLKATGTEVKLALEHAINASLAPIHSNGAFPYTGGLRWTLDLNQPLGKRLSNMQLRTADGNYEAFDLSKTYNVATISFIADGQDHYTPFKDITGERRVEVGLDYADAFLQYIQDLPGTSKVLRKIPTKDYSTQVLID